MNYCLDDHRNGANMATAMERRPPCRSAEPASVGLRLLTLPEAITVLVGVLSAFLSRLGGRAWKSTVALLLLASVTVSVFVAFGHLVECDRVVCAVLFRTGSRWWNRKRRSHCPICPSAHS